MLKFILLTFVTLITSCQITEAEIEDDMLDSNLMKNPAIADSSYYLISDSLSNPTQEEKNKPVLIAAHGFSASAWQLQELRDFADSTQEFLVSLVTLGGHGRDYEDFKNASWSDWQLPILQEFTKLDSLGFTNISILGVSTGGTLTLEALHHGRFIKNPKFVFLIDPIIIPGDKILSLSDWADPILGNNISKQKDEERSHTYSNRPVEALAELNSLCTHVREHLEDGWSLESETQAFTWKAKKDGSADPLSALIIKRGLSLSNGKITEVNLVDSDNHIFIQSNNKTSWSDKEKSLQMNTFNEISTRLLSN